MDSLQLKICDVQGRLFELSRKACYDSGPFISSFMRSRLAKSLDSVYNRMQWSGAVSYTHLTLPTILLV